MALMIPNEVRASTSSSAEKKLFTQFRDGLSAQWTVFHSLGLANHSKKQWGEADFVVVGPHGIFCLEVKGGRIRREGGLWIFIDGDDVEHPKAEGPFEQAKTASYAIRDYLRDSIPSLYSATFGWGVMTPDISFTIQGPDITPEIIYDERDLMLPLSRYLRRIGEHWHEQHERKTGYDARFLSDDERKAITEALRGDFDLRPTLRARVNGVEDDLVQLTLEQRGVLESLHENPRLMVQGGAGTGKTLLAIEEARRHASEGKRVLVVCYNRTLGRHLERAIKDFGPNAKVWAGHFALLMEQLVTEAGLQSRVEVNAEEIDIWDVFLPAAAFEAILQLGKEGMYDVIIIDEGQDFGVKHLEVFDALLKEGWENGQFAVFYDPFQIPFRTGASQVIAGFVNGDPVRCKLTINCRNTHEIAWATEALSEISTSESARANGPDPQWLWTKNDADARVQIASCLKDWISQGLSTEDIVILSPVTLSESVIKGLPLATSIRAWSGEDTIPPKAIRFASIGEFKGMEAKAVLLCDANDWDDEHLAVLFYVALSRPSSLLAVALDQSLKGEWVERFSQQGVKWKERQVLNRAHKG